MSDIPEDVLDDVERAMTALHDDMLERSRAGIDVIYGEEYHIVNAGRTAWSDFCTALGRLREARRK